MKAELSLLLAMLAIPVALVAIAWAAIGSIENELSPPAPEPAIAAPIVKSDYQRCVMVQPKPLVQSKKPVLYPNANNLS